MLFKLIGGGICGSKHRVANNEYRQFDIEIPVGINISDVIDESTQMISDNILKLIDPKKRQIVWNSIRIFQNVDIYMYKLSNEDRSAKQCIGLFEKVLLTLINSINESSRSNQSICVELCYIANNIGRLIFRYYKQDTKRLMDSNTKDNLVQQMEDVYEKVKVENQDLSQIILMELDVLLIFISTIQSKKEENETNQAMSDLFKGVINSGLSMKIDDQLIDALINSGKIFYKQSKNKQQIQILATILYLQQIKYKIQNQLNIYDKKIMTSSNITNDVFLNEVIDLLQQVYQKTIRSNREVLIIAEWIKLLYSVLTHKTLINKEQLKNVFLQQTSQNNKQKNFQSRWNELIKNRSLVQIYQSDEYVHLNSQTFQNENQNDQIQNIFDELNSKYKQIDQNILKSTDNYYTQFQKYGNSMSNLLQENKQDQQNLFQSMNYLNNILEIINGQQEQFQLINQKNNINENDCSQNFLSDIKNDLITYIKSVELLDRIVIIVFRNIESSQQNLKDEQNYIFKKQIQENIESLYDLSIKFKYEISFGNFLQERDKNMKNQSSLKIKESIKTFNDENIKKYQSLQIQVQKINNIAKSLSMQQQQITATNNYKKKPILDGILQTILLINLKQILFNIEQFNVIKNKYDNNINDKNNQDEQQFKYSLFKIKKYIHKNQNELTNKIFDTIQILNQNLLRIYQEVQVNDSQKSISTSENDQISQQQQNDKNEHIIQQQKNFDKLIQFINQIKIQRKYQKTIIENFDKDINEIKKTLNEIQKFLNEQNNINKTEIILEYLLKIKSQYMEILQRIKQNQEDKDNSKFYNFLNGITEDIQKKIQKFMQLLEFLKKDNRQQNQESLIKVFKQYIKQLLEKNETYQKSNQTDNNILNITIQEDIYCIKELKIIDNIMNDIQQDQQSLKDIQDKIKIINLNKSIQEIIWDQKENQTDDDSQPLTNADIIDLTNQYNLKFESFNSNHQILKKAIINIYHQVQSKAQVQIELIYDDVQQMYGFEQQMQSDIIEYNILLELLDHNQVLKENNKKQQKLFQNQINLVKNLVSDIIQKEDWKVRIQYLFHMIKLKQSGRNDQIIKFANEQIVQIKFFEIDGNVKQIFKSEEIISLTASSLKEYWKSQEETIKNESEEIINKIKEIQQRLKQENNEQQRQMYFQQIHILQNDLEQKIINMQDVQNQLGILIPLIMDIKSELTQINEQLQNMNKKMDLISLDIQYLKGKTYQELFLIRKQKILDQKKQNDLENFILPLKTIIKQQNYDIQDQKIINQNNNNNQEDLQAMKDNHIKKFLNQNKQYNTLLITGLAGSGKSTITKTIEELLWENIEQQQQFPILIQLPQLQNAKDQAIQETLRSSQYNFEDKQINQLKQDSKDGKISIIFILDSYDETQYKKINLCSTNNFQYWTNFQSGDNNEFNTKIIITARKESLSEVNYRKWFFLKDDKFLQEIEIQEFSDSDRENYIKEFVKLSFKKIVFKLFEQNFKKNMYNLLDEKIKLWEKIMKLKIDYDQQEILFNDDQKQKIKIILQEDKNITPLNQQSLEQLDLQLSDIWTYKEYYNQINELQLQSLLRTPYLLYIITLVLPIINNKYQDIIKLKNRFGKQFDKIFQAEIESKQNLQKYYQKLKEIEKNNDQKQLEDNKDNRLDAKLNKLKITQKFLNQTSFTIEQEQSIQDQDLVSVQRQQQKDLYDKKIKQLNNEILFLQILKRNKQNYTLKVLEENRLFYSMKFIKSHKKIEQKISEISLKKFIKNDAEILCQIYIQKLQKFIEGKVNFNTFREKYKIYTQQDIKKIEYIIKSSNSNNEENEANENDQDENNQYESKQTQNDQYDLKKREIQQKLKLNQQIFNEFQKKFNQYDDILKIKQSKNRNQSDNKNQQETPNDLQICIQDKNEEYLENFYSKLEKQFDFAKLIHKCLSKKRSNQYEFFKEYFNYHFKQQINEVNNQMMNEVNFNNNDTLKNDYMMYSQQLAIQMFKDQCTAVKYIPLGKFEKNIIDNKKNINQNQYEQFFNDDEKNQYGNYLSKLKKIVPIRIQGNTYQFIHKILQEFALSQNIVESIKNYCMQLNDDCDNQKTYKNKSLNEKEKPYQYKIQQFLLKKLKEHKNDVQINQYVDQLQYLQFLDYVIEVYDQKKKKRIRFKQINNNQEQQQIQEYYQEKIFNDIDQFIKKNIYTRSEQEEEIVNKTLKLLNSLQHANKQLIDSYLYQNNLNTEYQNGIIESVSQQIKKKTQFHAIMIQLIQLTSIEIQMVTGGSNIFTILNTSDADLTYKDFEEINLKHSRCDGVILKGSNLQKSKLDHCSLNFINIDNADISSAQWTNCESYQLLMTRIDSYSKNILYSKDKDKDNKYIIVGDIEGRIKIYDSTNLQLIQEWSADKQINCMYLNDKNQLITGGLDGIIRIWEIDQIQSLNENNQCNILYQSDQKLQQNKQIICLDYFENDIVTGHDDNTVIYWKYETQQINQYSQKEIDAIKIQLQFIFIMNKNQILYGNNGTKIIIQDINNNHKIKEKKREYESDTLIYDSSKQKIIYGQKNIIMIEDLIENNEVVNNYQNKLYKPNQNNQQIKMLSGHKGNIVCVKLSSFKKYILSACNKNIIIIWKYDEYQQYNQFNLHTDEILCLSSSLDQKKIVSIGKDKQIRVWDNSEIQQLHRQKITKKLIHKVIFSNDMKKIASIDEDFDINIWNYANSSELYKIHSIDVKKIEKKYVESLYLQFSKDDNKILSIIGILRIYDVNNGTLLFKQEKEENKILCAQFMTINNNLILTGTKFGNVCVWDINSKINQNQIQINKEGIMINNIICSNNCQKILAVVNKTKIIMIDNLILQNQTPIKLDLIIKKDLSQEYDRNKQKIENRLILVYDFEKETKNNDENPVFIKYISLQNDQQIILLNGDGKILYLEIQNGQWMIKNQIQIDNINILGFSLDHQIVVGNGKIDERNLYAYDIQKRFQILQLRGHNDCILSSQISNDGLKIVSGGFDQTIRVWQCLDNNDFNQNKLNDQIDGIDDLNNKIINYNPLDKLQNKEISYDDSDINKQKNPNPQINIFQNKYLKQSSDIDENKVVELKGHNKYIKCLSISSDGKLIASVGDDQRLLIWDIQEKKSKIQISLENKDKDIESISITQNQDKYFIITSNIIDKINKINLWKYDLTNQSGYFKEELLVVDMQNNWKMNYLTFSYDGNYFLSRIDDSQLQIWQYRNNKQKIYEQYCSINDKRKQIDSYSFFYQDNQQIITAGKENIKIWQLQKNEGGEIKQCKYKFQIENQQYQISCISSCKDKGQILYIDRLKIISLFDRDIGCLYDQFFNKQIIQIKDVYFNDDQISFLIQEQNIIRMSSINFKGGRDGGYKTMQIKINQLEIKEQFIINHDFILFIQNNGQAKIYNNKLQDKNPYLLEQYKKLLVLNKEFVIYQVEDQIVKTLIKQDQEKCEDIVYFHSSANQDDKFIFSSNGENIISYHYKDQNQVSIIKLWKPLDYNIYDLQYNYETSINFKISENLIQITNDNKCIAIGHDDKLKLYYTFEGLNSDDSQKIEEEQKNKIKQIYELPNLKNGNKLKGFCFAQDWDKKSSPKFVLTWYVQSTFIIIWYLTGEQTDKQIKKFKLGKYEQIKYQIIDIYNDNQDLQQQNIIREIQYIQISSKFDQIICTLNDTRTIIYNIKDSNIEKVFFGDSKDCFNISIDGQKMITGTSDGIIRLQNLKKWSSNLLYQNDMSSQNCLYNLNTQIKSKNQQNFIPLLKQNHALEIFYQRQDCYQDEFPLNDCYYLKSPNDKQCFQVQDQVNYDDEQIKLNELNLNNNKQKWLLQISEKSNEFIFKSLDNCKVITVINDQICLQIYTAKINQKFRIEKLDNKNNNFFLIYQKNEEENKKNYLILNKKTGQITLQTDNIENNVIEILSQKLNISKLKSMKYLKINDHYYIKSQSNNLCLEEKLNGKVEFCSQNMKDNQQWIMEQIQKEQNIYVIKSVQSCKVINNIDQNSIQTMIYEGLKTQKFEIQQIVNNNNNNDYNNNFYAFKLYNTEKYLTINIKDSRVFFSQWIGSKNQKFELLQCYDDRSQSRASNIDQSKQYQILFDAFNKFNFQEILQKMANQDQVKLRLIISGVDKNINDDNNTGNKIEQSSDDIKEKIEPELQVKQENAKQNDKTDGSFIIQINDLEKQLNINDAEDNSSIILKDRKEYSQNLNDKIESQIFKIFQEDSEDNMYYIYHDNSKKYLTVDIVGKRMFLSILTGCKYQQFKIIEGNLNQLCEDQSQKSHKIIYKSTSQSQECVQCRTKNNSNLLDQDCKTHLCTKCFVKDYLNKNMCPNFHQFNTKPQDCTKISCVICGSYDSQSKCEFYHDRACDFDLCRKCCEKLLKKYSKPIDKTKIETITFEWDIEKSNQIQISNLGIIPLSWCSTQQYILSKDTLPSDQKSYFVIKRSHTQGCYDSIGLCTIKDKNIRNGEDSNGWALRLHGVNKDTTFTGLVHNSQFTKFFEDWEENDEIGVLYDPLNQKMSYYKNGKYLGTPFKNVKGELYICVENCHKQGFSKVDDPDYPEEPDIEFENNFDKNQK